MNLIIIMPCFGILCCVSQIVFLLKLIQWKDKMKSYLEMQSKGLEILPMVSHHYTDLRVAVTRQDAIKGREEKDCLLYSTQGCKQCRIRNVFKNGFANIL